MLEADFWQDKIKSKIILKEKKLYEDLINSFNETIKHLKDFDDLHQLAIEENNKEIETEVYTGIKDLRTSTKKMKSNVFFLKKRTH
tara:strand:- start:1418 stop:1675 length:258 start_codon:yes stop_codon:yes gene_type:complete